jgi:hypothetical protein
MTRLGGALMQARCDLVERHYHGILCDVGIGSGAFVEARNQRFPGSTLGYDVNPAGRHWLHARQLWRDPHLEHVDAVSLFDVLEHIQDFRPLLANVRRWLFVSLPIFRDAEHALASKHFRPLEHSWYFTQAGLLSTLGALGFVCAEISDDETRLGREDILSFAFRRVT